MNDKFRDQSIREILDIEQGYVDDPSDSGGETNFGITVVTARKNGYKGKMKDMPESVAIKIYMAPYWNGLNLDAIFPVSENIAKELFDTGVNMGVRASGKFFQRSLNVLNNGGKYHSDVVVDGRIGPGTLRAFEAFVAKRGEEGLMVLFNMLNCLQGAFYVKLAERRAKDERFIYGWFKNRVSVAS